MATDAVPTGNGAQATAPAQFDFPQSPSAFADDDRVAYSTEDQKHILETDAGDEYEWDTGLKRWIPVMDQAEIEQQQAAYINPAEETTETAREANRKKRKQMAEEDHAQKKQRVNKAVYVTSIPLDADEDEIKALFSKCGLIAEEIDSGRPRIKMYEDEQGNFKGEALVIYFRPESVQLAVQMLDDTDFRFGMKGPNGKMRVQEADSSFKKAPAETTEQAKRSKREQRKVIAKTQKMNNKLADWDDDDPQAIQETSSRWDKVVIVKHVFTLDEIAEDPAAMLEIKEDMREEAAKLGDVTNVQLFDKETDGVVSIRYTTPTAAQACMRLFDGRWFGGRQLEAFIATGNERFKRTNTKAADANSDDEGERLDAFGEWLEGGQPAAAAN